MVLNRSHAAEAAATADVHDRSTHRCQNHLLTYFLSQAKSGLLSKACYTIFKIMILYSFVCEWIPIFSSKKVTLCRVILSLVVRFLGANVRVFFSLQKHEMGPVQMPRVYRYRTYYSYMYVPLIASYITRPYMFRLTWKSELLLPCDFIQLNRFIIAYVSATNIFFYSGKVIKMRITK